MKVTLESTARIVTVDGVPGRVWEGVTAGGAQVLALITQLAVPAGEDLTEFEAELQSMRAPSDASARAFPDRMIL